MNYYEYSIKGHGTAKLRGIPDKDNINVTNGILGHQHQHGGATEAKGSPHIV